MGITEDGGGKRWEGDTGRGGFAEYRMRRGWFPTFEDWVGRVGNRDGSLLRDEVKEELGSIEEGEWRVPTFEERGRLGSINETYSSSYS